MRTPMQTQIVGDVHVHGIRPNFTTKKGKKKKMYNINVCMYTYAPSSWQIFPIRKAVVKDLSVDQVENKLLTETIHAQHTQHT